MAYVFEQSSSVLNHAELEGNNDDLFYFQSYLSRKTMFILLQRAILCNDIKSIYDASNIKIPPFDTNSWEYINYAMEHYCDALFSNILYAYGWKNKRISLNEICEGSYSVDTFVESLKKTLLSENLPSDLVNALDEQEVLSNMQDIYLDESYIIFWENPAFSKIKNQILLDNHIDPAIIRKIEYFESKFLHMKRHNNLYTSSIYYHGKMHFYYLYEYFTDHMGYPFYSDAFYLQMHVPIYAAIADQYLNSISII